MDFELGTIASELPEISAATLYVWFMVQTVRAWIAPLPYMEQVLDGPRVWALVFGAAVLVVALLLNPATERELLVQALALAAMAVGGDQIQQLART